MAHFQADDVSKLDGTIHWQAAWILTLGDVERKRNLRLEPTPPPSGSSNKRPQLPSWGRFFLVTTFDAARGPTSRMVTSVGKQAPKTKTAPDEVSCRIIKQRG
jgi:hypothetical protein